ncbi:PD-(D/E)XK nuclease family protein [Stieleria marina]|uniref:ATP-dependent helicase/deoxyribonuclease subunit B n=1 Tax=Stieleria marina TaxID=1930275 RepID=A0A517NYU9_9BACT|nr:ATP-dependent helicase/deoxyribonuclease subunit B [Planctomycetes bacterium K23_9]
MTPPTIKPECHYLGWDSPLLPRAVDYLRDAYASGNRWDASRCICVLPAARSTRRLASLLRWESEEQDFDFRLPDIITVGQLAEKLYTPTYPLALDFEQTLAWSDVLRNMNPDDLRPLVPTLPLADAVSAWLELAGTLRRLHSELASSSLSFADVVKEAETESEQRRWKLLDQLFGRYLQTLQQAGVADPHQARRDAIAAQQCGTPQDVILIGTTDLSDVVTEMLLSLPSKVISLVAAPDTAADHFDSLGSVKTSAWVDCQLPLRDEQLIPAADIADQSAAVAETLAEFADLYAADQITVGVTDESQVGPVEIHLRGCGVPTYRHLGWSISQTAVGRLFDLTATYLQRQNWQSLAALVRHADVHTWLTQKAAKENNQKAPVDWLPQIDALLANHFPRRVDEPLSPKAVEDFPIAITIAEWINDWLKDFLTSEKVANPKPLSHWSGLAQQWLCRIYVDTHFTSDASESSATVESPTQAEPATRTEHALTATQRLLERFTSLNDHLDVAVSGAIAFEMLAQRLGDTRIADTADPGDVEILGWLDLALDDAPAMVVVGLNHPFVPGAITSDPFLPGTLRTRLRMVDNERRYARDAYAMHLMLSTRNSIRFIVGQNSADGSPTPPSRLIAAAPPVDSARRIRYLLGGQRTKTVVKHQWDNQVKNTQLPIPALNADPTRVKTMSVTAFRDYMVCPYRFYLRHVLKMRPVDDLTGELAANQFGDLVHGALERYGLSDQKTLTDVSQIESALIQHLHDYAADIYADNVAMAVKLQVKQAEKRLQVVAKVQAERIAAGWQIRAAEASVNETPTKTADGKVLPGAIIQLDGESKGGKSMGIRGRFDRIDYHPDTGRWAILDYKTHGHKPEKKHLKKTDDGDEWIDLQLPLYRLMVPFLGIDAPASDVELGYFNISEKEEETKINIANFSDEQLDAADEVVHEIIRSIHAGKFDPTGDRVQYDDYDMILQTSITQRQLITAEKADAVAVEENR